jgi:hypothetical protein
VRAEDFIGAVRLGWLGHPLEDSHARRAHCVPCRRSGEPLSFRSSQPWPSSASSWRPGSTPTAWASFPRPRTRVLTWWPRSSPSSPSASPDGRPTRVTPTGTARQSISLPWPRPRSSS